MQMIKGYRQLDQDELDLINQIKEHAEQTRELVHRVSLFVTDQESAPLPQGHAPHSTITSPMRWVHVAQTDLQQGYMALTRAVAQPETF